MPYGSVDSQTHVELWSLSSFPVRNKEAIH